ncbi:hypothetical protein G6F50_017204 [Rhizopus delemar]|uniref:Uncharacterized protein n=1 Tax=Rhizopus delemar TaxID=936053 RepID=A0A9P7C029_9FUNG|nr:hypothetical protein G6F50_017204 [Rhizopus delemar]
MPLVSISSLRWAMCSARPSDSRCTTSCSWRVLARICSASSAMQHISISAAITAASFCHRFGLIMPPPRPDRPACSRVPTPSAAAADWPGRFQSCCAAG